MDSRPSAEFSFESLYIATLAVCASFICGLCFQRVLELVGAVMLTYGQRISPLGAITATSLVLTALSLGYLLLFHFALRSSLSHDENRNWSTAHIWFALSGLAVLAFSLIQVPLLSLSGPAKILIYLQLIPTALWGGFCWLSLLRVRPSTISEASRRLYSLLHDLVFYGHAVALLLFGLSVSNLLHWLHLAHPSLSPEVFEHGLRAGLLIGLWRNASTAGIRSLMTVAFIVDWVGDKLMPYYLVPGAQLILVLLAWIPLRSKFNGWEGLARAGLGLSLGRILGRILGVLLLGEAGPTLMEPIAEILVTIWMLPELATPNQESSPSDSP